MSSLVCVVFVQYIWWSDFILFVLVKYISIKLHFSQNILFLYRPKFRLIECSKCVCFIKNIITGFLKTLKNIFIAIVSYKYIDYTCVIVSMCVH